ncbi:BGTF surface domain-containing protein [Halegenticoccus soli]|uniref:BGTF surface domain-containing protein n=1 Tax=Halegenticoccus soli TaxID=1985678 RepID=UPI000C6D2F43|nr:BGTF surface domain-containing protein [Halegenticoccus soli]
MTAKTNDKIRGLFLAAMMVLSAFAGAVAFAGTAAAANSSQYDAELSQSGTTTIYQGQIAVAGNLQSGETYEIREYDGENVGSLEAQADADTDGDILIDTTKLENGFFAVEAPDDSTTHKFEVVEQAFSAEFANEEVANDESTTLTIESRNRADAFDVVVTSEDAKSSSIKNIFPVTETDIDGDGENELVLEDVEDGAEFTANFDGRNIGNYTFDFEVADTTASDSASVEVVKPGDEKVNLVDRTIQVDRGDSVTFEVELKNTQSGYIIIGDAEDDGFEVRADLVEGEEDGVANVTLNTYKSGDTGTAGLSGDVENVNAVETTSGVLAAGNYDIEVRTSESTSADDVGTLSVMERSTTGAGTWVTYADVADDLEDSDDVIEAIENNQLTQTSDVAQKDYAVIAVEASGIYGSLGDTTGDSYNIDTASDDVSVTIEQTNPAKNREAKVYQNENLEIITDDERNLLFFVIELDGNVLDRNGAVGFEDGDRYEVNFTVLGDGKLAEEDETVKTSFTVDDRSVSLDLNDDDKVEVEASENATISGDTNVAPGTDITFRLQSESGADNPFFMTETMNVTQDGSFEGTFDFSEVEAGAYFSVAVSATPDLSGETSFDGVVVEAQPDETTTEENETTTETPTPTETTTETPEPTDTDTATPEPTDSNEGGNGGGEDTTTPEEGPGFGVVVALVALVAAALLAVRREN